jgi:hypothetical protein
VHDTTQPVPAPKLLDATPAQLVETLAHPNGWHRDTAQKLLVLKQDQSVVPALIDDGSENMTAPITRIHALVDARRSRGTHRRIRCVPL